MKNGVGAVVPAAGLGQRLGAGQHKALIPLDGRPLIAHVLDVLQRVPAIRWVVVAAHPNDGARLREMGRRQQWRNVTIVEGGASRAESVARGISALPPEARWVLVHDAARPCLSRRLVEATLRAARRYGAAAAGLPAGLTVKTVDAHGFARLTLDRDSLWLMQTPQVFRRDWMEGALSRVNGRAAEFPDDAALLEWAGFPVRMVPGDPGNLKVTTQADMMLAAAVLRSQRSQDHARGNRVR